MIETLTVLADDIDARTRTNVETVRFMLDGTTYELELGAVNRRKLAETFAPYIACARKPKVAGNGTRPKGTVPRVRKPTNTEVREWARARGITVRDRGRIAAEIMDQFRAWQQSYARPA